MENKKKGFNLRTVIPLATIIVSLVFIVVGLKNYGFWKAQPTPGFFPIIIAVVLLASSIACFVQIARDKSSDDVKYNRNELMVMLGAAGIILCTFLIGLVPSCLIYIFLWLKFVEHAPWKVIIIIELIMAAIILGVFTAWLQIRFSKEGLTWEISYLCSTVSRWPSPLKISASACWAPSWAWWWALCPASAPWPAAPCCCP